MAIEENVSEWRFGWVIRILVPMLGSLGLLFPTLALVITSGPAMMYLPLAGGALLLCAATLIFGPRR